MRLIWLLVAYWALPAACWASRAAQTCPVQYGGTGKPLLFGGVNQPGRCRAGCHRVNTYWLNSCRYQHGRTWGACTDAQAARSLEYAKTLGGGQALQLSPCGLVPYLNGRTLWLLGDSHTKSFYRALQCFLIDFWDHQGECEASSNAQAVQQLKKLPGAAGDSQCIHLRGPAGGRICIVHVVLGTSLVNNKEVADGGVLPLLRSKFAKPEDIFVINFSTWHKKSSQWWSDYRPALNALGQYYQATRKQWPHLLFRETPAKHPTARSGDKCKPAAGLTFKRSTGALEVASAARSDSQFMWTLGAQENKLIGDVMSRYGIPVVPAFNITVELADNHVGMAMNPEIDCLHYCHPGVPEIMIWYMFNTFRNGPVPVRPLNVNSKVQQEAARFKCVNSISDFRD